jgi:hypothetical protein
MAEELTQQETNMKKQENPTTFPVFPVWRKTH